MITLLSLSHKLLLHLDNGELGLLLDLVTLNLLKARFGTGFEPHTPQVVKQLSIVSRA